MLRRLLERPCSLALLIGCQFAFVAYFSLGGFRNLTALFGRSSPPAVDYSRTHDVYANLSRLLPQGALRDPAEPLPYCPQRSPLLREWGAGGSEVRGQRVGSRVGSRGVGWGEIGAVCAVGCGASGTPRAWLGAVGYGVIGDLHDPVGVMKYGVIGTPMVGLVPSDTGWLGPL